MTRLIVLAIAICFLAIAAFSQPKSKIAQQATATFPELGLVRIRVIETPTQPIKLEFYSLRDKKTISSIEMENSTLPDEPGPASSFLRFKVMTVPGQSQPLIFVVEVSPGGSDGTFFAHIIGWKEGKFQILNEESIETAVQGGLYFGNLGKKYGYGVASWTFIWCSEVEPPEPNCREAHYDKYRYEIKLYPLDVKTMTFKEPVTFKTKRKYAGHGEAALKEFGFTFQDLRRSMGKVREYADYQ
ncbi:MAG: hypothetical protein JST84_27280 [Acidobacteria bacterium]|nr:hypothetical protein [Acidobacteriota bacterium]